MAHIVNCMLEAEQDHINHKTVTVTTMPGSPVSRTDLVSEKAEKPYVWRMYQPERKYQLFPKKDQQQAPAGKSLDPEQAFALAMNQSATNADKLDKSSSVSGLRLRLKEHNLNRRRKVSVPELGPMTTVQEVPMDSPTIPGRPPLHERSISAPGHSMKNHHLAEVMIPSATIMGEISELGISSADSSTSGSGSPLEMLPKSRLPLSPKSLTPLVIPVHGAPVPKLNGQRSLNRLRSGSTPIDSAVSARTGRTEESGMTRAPFTPLSSSMTTPRSASTVMTNSTLPTPVTAPIESRESPKPWETSAASTPQTERKDAALPDLQATPKVGAAASASAPTTAPSSETRPPMYHNANGHRRNQSESSGSIMERGRPRKRCDIIPGGIVVGSASKRSRSADRRAFESLPKGWKASEAPAALAHAEAAALQKQALQQAARFEVLRKEDVEALSKELRQLDERTEYLRRTYNSLRAGRRNLHARICQYLRSPRVAKFSHDSMLKQEEALAELDNSIDDWIGKLEQADNRRTRVRQKLLEHVAAAVTMPLSPGSVQGVSECLQMAMGIRTPHPCLTSNGAGNISTPPRSPTRQQLYISSAQQSPSPKRFVPSTILEQPLGEETATAEEVEAHRRAVESIRVYAGDDVYALLADVESEFTKMSTGGETSSVEKQEVPEQKQQQDGNLSDDERRDLHRARSHEVLNSLSKKSSANSIASEKPASPVRATAATIKQRRCSIAPKPAPAVATAPSSDGEIFLTSAVFKP